MARNTTPSHALELKLNTTARDDRALNDRFFTAFLMQNRLVTHAKKCLKGLRQDKAYRQLMRERAETKADTERLKQPDGKKVSAELAAAKKRLNGINDSLRELRLKYGLSEHQFHVWISVQQHRYKNHIDSLTAQKVATRVWEATEAVLFRKGKTLHYKKLEHLYSLEGKNNASGIRFKNGRLQWLGLEIQPQLRKGDTYARKALQHRVKYCRIVRRAVGGRWHFYLQLVLEGTPPKKHAFLEGGNVGIDPGVSCEAVVSDNGCLLAEIMPAGDIQKEVRRLQRKMGRSRRANNPDNYNTDGTVKPKHRRKKWVDSKTYKRDLMGMKSLRRRNAATLEQNENILANTVLEEHGSNVFTEKMDYAALQKKAKESAVDERTGRHRSRRRFGRSIAGHAPSRFLAILERKLSYIGKAINYVDTWKFKASQYDHTVGDYVKPGLSDRWKDVGGRSVQRDLYSAFLLKNALDPEAVDREACAKTFEAFLKMHDTCIAAMKAEGISRPAVFGF